MAAAGRIASHRVLGREPKNKRQALAVRNHDLNKTKGEARKAERPLFIVLLLLWEVSQSEMKPG
jgi:hypothetical protein